MTTTRRSPGVAGGGLPARIWRDFMTQALGAAPARLAPAPPLEAPVEGGETQRLGHHSDRGHRL